MISSLRRSAEHGSQRLIKNSSFLALSTTLSTIFLVGCPSSTPHSIDRVPTGNQSESEILKDEFLHNFGLILSEGQTLRHRFALKNLGDGPLLLKRAIAFSPCCSTIRVPAAPIPPGGGGVIEVEFRTGVRSGPQAIKFLVETDVRERPRLQFELRAQLVPAWEVRAIGEGLESIRVGEAGRRRLRVTCRRSERSGLTAPETIVSTGLLRAAFSGEARVRTYGDGLILSERDVELQFDPNDEPGSHAGTLEFGWPGEPARMYPVNWEVVPTVNLAPSGVVLLERNGAVKRLFQVTADDRPFRITSVTGAALSRPYEPPATPARRHLLQLELDPSKVTPGVAADVRIETDHPLGRSLSLSVLVPAPEASRRIGP